MSKINYVTSVSATERIVRDVLLLETPIIAVNCKGCNLGRRGGFISFISLCTWDGHVYVFDVKKTPEVVLTGGLIRLLQSTEMLKVFHNCSADSATLYHQFGIKIRNYFDTQAAYMVILENHGLPPRRISLQSLCEKYSIARYAPSEELCRLIAEDPSAWVRRPASRDMLNAVAADVMPLVPTLFEKLTSEIPSESKEWCAYLCEENQLSLIKETVVKNTRNRRRQKKQREQLYQLPILKLSAEQKCYLENTVADTH